MSVLAEAPRIPTVVSSGTMDVFSSGAPISEHLPPEQREYLIRTMMADLFKPLPVRESKKPHELAITHEEIEELRSGFQVIGHTLYDASYVLNQPVGLLTKNGLSFNIHFGNGRLNKYPIARNFDTEDPKVNQDITGVDLESIANELRAGHIPPLSTIGGRDIHHRFIDYLLEENKDLWADILSPNNKGYIWFSETDLGVHNGAPDHILLDPLQGFYLIDQFQSTMSDGYHRKGEKVRKHVKGLTEMFTKLYGTEVQPRVMPVILRFVPGELPISISVRPYAYGGSVSAVDQEPHPIPEVRSETPIPKKAA